ncbi:tyrosine-protein phosphatase [Persicobacter sp. CCB-QB2]|uniref:tyrosine-protein phosphatase n=1 Tax=Persicobacter sp. CCB-QB2 TaxID=1561025 RepID=UPI0006A9D8BB|nr:tyrosine-protein phosphatase [Persicobacter sp. CCB-QB2]
MRKILLAITALTMMACGRYTAEETPERTLFEEIYVSRTAEGYHFENFGKQEWQLFLNGKAIGSLKNQQDFAYAPEKRAVFLAVSGNDSLWVSERNLAISGEPNFRDIGGIKTKDGRQVRWGAIYRCGELKNVDKKGWQKLSSLNIATKVDFRSLEEREESQDEFSAKLGATEHSLWISPGNMEEFKAMLKDNTLTAEDGIQMLTDVNRHLVKDWAYRYKEYFQLLKDTEQPLVFHCTAGKDRTGLCSALTLYALGVDMETILDEYEMSNHYRHGKNEELIKRFAFTGVSQDLMRVMMSVRRDCLAAAFDQMALEYGSVEQFMAEALEVSQEDILSLKAKYLY